MIDDTDHLLNALRSGNILNKLCLLSSSQKQLLRESLTAVISLKMTEAKDAEKAGSGHRQIERCNTNAVSVLGNIAISPKISSYLGLFTPRDKVFMTYGKRLEEMVTFCQGAQTLVRKEKREIYRGSERFVARKMGPLIEGDLSVLLS